MKEIKKTYLAPSVKVMNVQMEDFIAASLNISIEDEYADGDSEVLSKENNFNSVWDEDEE